MPASKHLASADVMKRNSTTGKHEREVTRTPTSSGRKYGSFLAMISVSTLVMYGLMYFNSYELDHVFFSQTRMWMALYMGGAMAIIMLAFMLGMYSNKGANVAIFSVAAVAFAAGLYLVRSQETVGDVAWMKAMIPHHSIAILTSERANFSDPRVRELADAIIEAQRGEIAEMKRYIADIEANGDAPAGTSRTSANN